jgi:hypothetical protein
LISPWTRCIGRLVNRILVWQTESCAEFILVGSFDCVSFHFVSSGTAVVVQFALSVVLLLFSLLKLHL